MGKEGKEGERMEMQGEGGDGEGWREREGGR